MTEATPETKLSSNDIVNEKVLSEAKDSTVNDPVPTKEDDSNEDIPMSNDFSNDNDSKDHSPRPNDSTKEDPGSATKNTGEDIVFEPNVSEVNNSNSKSKSSGNGSSNSNSKSSGSSNSNSSSSSSSGSSGSGSGSSSSSSSSDSGGGSGRGNNHDDKTFPSRFPLWYALTVFSAISLISICTETNPKEWFAEEKFLVFVTIFSLLVSCVACMGNIVKRENFVGQPLEGLWLFTELGLWVGGLVVMMDTDNFLAVDTAGNILNANLYFFGWASLITTVALFVAYGFQVNDETMTSGNTQSAGYWAGICVASLVVSISALQTLAKSEAIDGLEYDCHGDFDDHSTGYCERLKFSVSLGSMSTLVAGVCSFLAFKMSNELNGFVSFIMLFAWTLGVAFATFGEKSPANRVGNLYFSSWAAFVMSLFMVSTSVKNYLATKHEHSSDNKAKHPAPLDTDRPEEAPNQIDNEAETSTPAEGVPFPSSDFPQTDATVDATFVPENVPVSSIEVPSPV